MSAYGDLYDVGAEVLAFAVATLSPAVSGYGATMPGRTYVSNGAVAYDFGCDLLAVEVLPARTGIPGLPIPEPVSATTTLNVDVAVHIIRCAPTMDDRGDPPSAADIDGSARIVLADAWTLFHGVIAGLQAHTLLGTCSRAVIVSLDPYGPEGTAVGSVLRLNVSL